MGAGIFTLTAEHRASNVFSVDRIENQNVAGSALKSMHRPDSYLVLESFMPDDPLDKVDLSAVGANDANSWEWVGHIQRLFRQPYGEEGVVDVEGRAFRISKGDRLGLGRIDEDQGFSRSWGVSRQ